MEADWLGFRVRGSMTWIIIFGARFLNILSRAFCEIRFFIFGFLAGIGFLVNTKQAGEF